MRIIFVFILFLFLSENSLAQRSEVDSSCIKNAALSPEEVREEFLTQLNTVITRFIHSDKIELASFLTYNDSIGAEDISLGHYWSLGKGIYPNKKKYKFGNPISFRRVECPHFDGTVTYFYTSESKEIKVISFNWKELKENPLGMPANRSEISAAFIKKYEYLMEEISKIIGKPKRNRIEKGGRRMTNWRGKKRVRVHMFNFSNYNEIRLYVYKK